MAQPNNTSQQQIKVRYNETSVTFASQFIVNINGDELILNCSPGPLTDPATGETILPVDCRIGMTMTAARRLHDVLTRVLTQQVARDEAGRETAAVPKEQQQ